MPEDINSLLSLVFKNILFYIIMDLSMNQNLSTNEDIEIILRQTSYNREEAIKYFNEFGSVEKCIEHYLGIKPRKEPEMSTNQKIFKSIRDFF